MQLPDFEHKRAFWDDWRAFHIDHGPFVQFDTGELVCTVYEPKPDRRKLYKAFNVQIVGSADAELPTLQTPEGEPIRRDWLNQGTLQYLLLDLDTRRAVRLAHPYRSKELPIPLRFQKRCSAYFAGAGCPPIGCTVTVNRPRKPTPEEQAHLDQLLDACHAWVGLQEEQTLAQLSWQASHKPIAKAQLLRLDFATMVPKERVRLVKRGTTALRQIDDYAYLTF